MPLHVVRTIAEASAALGDAPGPLVAVPVYNSPLDVSACLAALLEHTPPDVPILVIDDASPDTTSVDSVRAVDSGVPHTVVLLEHTENAGFVGSCNDAFAAAGRRDVVLVNSDVVVGAEWLERMVDAARSSNTVGTVSTLTNHGSILSVPNRNRPGPLPDGISPAEAARRVAAAAARSRPVLPTGVGHCIYVTRTALDVVGGFDPVFAPGYGEEVDLCLRAAEHGLLNVLADDVFVYHKGGSSFGVSPQKLKLQADHEAIVNSRHPRYEGYRQPFETADRSAFALALSTARRALCGITVAVDGFSLGPEMMGTQRFVIETACALADRDEIDHVDLFTPIEVPQYVARAAEGRTRLRVRPHPAFEMAAEHYDVVVRPYQVDHPVQLQWMRQMADVVVVSQLDLIAYHNPGYFGSDEALRAYREITAATFDVVDGVAFISRHSRDEAAREGLLARQHHWGITHCGIDHRSDSERPVPPTAAPSLRPGFVLVLGASYLHKHRMHAVETWRLLREGGFTGQLALVGPAPLNGSSVGAEAEWRAANPSLAADVLTMPSVSEAEKAWLLRNAALVAYPTLSEGFGMVPFEAAVVGTPVLTTRQGALDEVLPKRLETLTSMLPADAVGLARRLLADETFRAGQVSMLAEAAAGYTWERSASALVDLVRRALAEPTGRRVLHLAAAPPPRRSRAVLVDRMVALLGRVPLLKRAVGEGTRRQATVRRVANWARRKLS